MTYQQIDALADPFPSQKLRAWRAHLTAGRVTRQTAYLVPIASIN